MVRSKEREEDLTQKRQRASEFVRRGICETARVGGDWHLVATNDAINVDTALRWIIRGTPTLRRTGGTHNVKITEDH